MGAIERHLPRRPAVDRVSGMNDEHTRRDGAELDREFNRDGSTMTAAELDGSTKSPARSLGRGTARSTIDPTRPAPAAKPAQRVARDAESPPVTMRMFKALMSEMGDGVGGRFRSLSERIRVLEQRPAGMRYSGTWAPGEYAKDQAVTMSGGLWVAKETTTDRPGTSNQWQLAVKSPR